MVIKLTYISAISLYRNVSPILDFTRKLYSHETRRQTGEGGTGGVGLGGALMLNINEGSVQDSEVLIFKSPSQC